MVFCIWHPDRSYKDATFGGKQRVSRYDITTYTRRKPQSFRLPMQRTKPKVISVGNSNRERSVNNLIGKIYFVVSGKKLDYEDVWNINESLGSCGLQRSRCREQDPKSANRTSVCIKIQFRNPRKKCSQKLSRKFNLNLDMSQTAMHSLVFSNYLVSVRRNETQNWRVDEIFPIEVNVWIGCVVMLERILKNKKNHTQNIWRKNSIFFEKWIHQVLLKDSG